jgi:voltage-gated potassium channel
LSRPPSSDSGARFLGAPDADLYIPAMAGGPQQPAGGREWIHTVIFGTDTPAGRLFDVVLMWAIIASVAAVVLESVTEVDGAYRGALHAFEWAMTGLFSLEYALRLYSVRHPLRYARSFFGVIDLLSLLPTYLSLFVGGAQSLMVIRSLRLLRVFRVLKLAEYMGEAAVLVAAVLSSLRKITVFMGTVVCLALIMGSLMYVVEGPEHGFTSIPRGIYWAIVTLTTVGYGDLHPHTPLGQVVASLVMLMGYGIIAVPTGIVTVELGQAMRGKLRDGRACVRCSVDGHLMDALYCRRCGERLREPAPA